MRHTTLAVAALFLSSAAVHAQSFTQIVKVGDPIAGVGNVTIVHGLAVDNSGNALVHVLTDNVDPATNAAMIDVNAAVVVKEGDSVAQPSGATILSFNGGIVDFAGTAGPVFMPHLAGTTGTTDDEGYYIGSTPTLAIQKGATSSAPQLPSGSKYALLIRPRINSSNHLGFHCVVDDPNIAGSFNLDAFVVADPSTGTENVIWKEGDILPLQTWGINGFNWNEGWAFNDSDQFLFWASIAAASQVNQVVYLNSTKIAQKGDISPFGAAYAHPGSGLALNNHGAYALVCEVSVNDAIVLDGAAFVRAGDTLPDIEPFPIAELGTLIQLGDDGTLVWFGLWTLPSGQQGRGLFVNYSLLVEEGVTEIGGQKVLSVAGTQGRDFDCSASGRYLIFEALVEGVGDAAYVIDLWQ